MRLSFELRGGLSIISKSGALKPRAVAGRPSVTKFTHNSCTGIRASGMPRAAVKKILKQSQSVAPLLRPQIPTITTVFLQDTFVHTKHFPLFWHFSLYLPVIPQPKYPKPKTLFRITEVPKLLVNIKTTNRNFNSTLFNFQFFSTLGYCMDPKANFFVY